jgi:hypothetical protein
VRSARPLAALAALLWTGPAWAIDKAECKAAAEEGQALRDTARLGDARARFAVCAQAECPEPIRGDCADWLEQVDARRPSLVLTARNARGEDLVDVRVSSDGRELSRRLDGAEVALDPGAYTLRFEAAGLAPVELRVVVADGQKRRPVQAIFAAPDVARAAPTPPPDVSTPVAPWVLIGVAGAGLAVFGVMQGVARSELSDLEEGCGVDRTCPDEERDPVRMKFVVSGVALGVAGAAALGAAALWLFDAPDRPAAQAVRILPSWSPGSAAVRVSLPLSF